MNTAANAEARIEDIEVSGDTITARLMDGRTITVPLAWSWRLSDATPAQRANWHLIGDGHGVHWPDIDEDLSAEGMLRGVPARRPVKAALRQPLAMDNTFAPTVAHVREKPAKYKARKQR